jgi:hypothetical protein
VNSLIGSSALKYPGSFQLPEPLYESRLFCNRSIFVNELQVACIYEAVLHVFDTDPPQLATLSLPLLSIEIRIFRPDSTRYWLIIINLCLELVKFWLFDSLTISILCLNY